MQAAFRKVIADIDKRLRVFALAGRRVKDPRVIRRLDRPELGTALHGRALHIMMGGLCTHVAIDPVVDRLAQMQGVCDPIILSYIGAHASANIGSYAYIQYLWRTK